MKHPYIVSALMIASVCLSAIPRPVGALSAQHSRSRKQASSEEIEMARKQVRLEEQLADAQLKYTDTSPRIRDLRVQIWKSSYIPTPQAKSAVIAERLKVLQKKRTQQQDNVLQAQMKYTDAAPQLKDARQRLADINERIRIMQQQKRLNARQVN